MTTDRWAAIAARYDVIQKPLELAGRTWALAQIRDLNALVDRLGPEDFGPDERLPYWAALWPAAKALASHLVAAERTLGRTVELGCGLGLAAVVAAASGASQVLATDYEADALAFAERNAELNHVQLETRLCDWRDWSGAPELAHQFDTVLGADLVYEARNVEPLASSIALLLADGGLAMIADPGRPHLPALERALTERGLRALRGSTDGVVVLRATFTPGQS